MVGMEWGKDHGVQCFPFFISYALVRRVNLELLQEKGPMVWRHYNEQLDAFLKYLMWIAAEERQLLDQLNRQRRDEQSRFQSRIRQLEDNYRETTERIVHLRKTCNMLEQEIRNWSSESSRGDNEYLNSKEIEM